MTRFVPPLATGAIVAFAIGFGIPAHAAPQAADDCVGQGHIWVQIQHEDSLHGGCATTFANAGASQSQAGATATPSPTEAAGPADENAALGTAIGAGAVLVAGTAAAAIW